MAITRKSMLAMAKKLDIDKGNAGGKGGDEEDEPQLTDIQKYLVDAISNPNNDIVANMSLSEIENTKRTIMEDAGFNKSTRSALQKALRDYRYVDELSELREGCYTRWICLNKVEMSAHNQLQPKLTAGGILCEIKMTDAGVSLVCKNRSRFFQFNMETSLVFQKLTSQENVILYALEVTT